MPKPKTRKLSKTRSKTRSKTQSRARRKPRQKPSQKPRASRPGPSPSSPLRRRAELHALLLSQGLTQKRLASMAGVHKTYVSLIVTGRRTPSLGTASKMAQVLGVGLEEFHRLVGMRASRVSRKKGRGIQREAAA